MAKNFDQLEPALPVDNNEPRNTSNHLPRYFRTEFNNKFLNATLDQMISPGKVERINGYYGKKTAKAFNATDNYVGDVSQNREVYQFEPVSVVKDSADNVEFFADYNDYINTLDIRRGTTENHAVLNAQEYYAWDPHIDFDKFINFRNYYWLPSGPDPVTVVGNIKEITSTMTVELKEEDENILYQWTPDGLTGNRTITLYRGQTYRFEIDVPSYALAIATRVSFIPGKAILIEEFEGLRRPGIYDYLYYDMNDTLYDAGGWIIPPRESSFTEEEQENASLLYRLGMKFFDENGVENNNIMWMEKGVIEWTIPETAPDVLYYVSKDNANTSGVIKIHDTIEATEINVGEDIIGKKTYISESEVVIEGSLQPGVSLTNGMKVNFAGSVFPKMYEEGDFYVEGVGERIQLVPARDLDLSTSFVSNFEIEFDNQEFDYYPYSEAFGWPDNKDYIVINRSSIDGNLWSRHNRWFHIDVIQKSLEINGQLPVVDIDARAKRPIIEFEQNLKLFNFGTKNKKNVDLVDTQTKDIFSIIEGSVGYNIDGIDVSNGMRILFTADTDVRVAGRIYKVNFITFKNSYQITLQQEPDTEPLDNENVLVLQGNKYKGKFFHYTNGAWKLSQDKNDVNQSPLFDLYNHNDVSFTDPVEYNNSQFNGNKLFSYQIGEGNNDAELGFPVTYQNIQNSGDILFDFNLLNQTFLYTAGNDIFSQENTQTSFLRKYRNRTDYKNVNGYKKVSGEDQQVVIRQYIADGSTQELAIDVYDNLDFINDLWIRVYRNNEILKKDISYEIIQDVNGYHYVKIIDKVVKANDNIVIKTKSKYAKNNNGFYEIPYNLERNPSNDILRQFTLGEVIDHVATIVEEMDSFDGVFPGESNLRDLGDVAVYGKKFLKHSAPFNLSAYHICNNNSNVIDAIDFARVEYAKFKREFLETATNLGFDGPVKKHVDLILNELIVQKNEDLPFYFSDMVPVNGQLTNSEEIYDEDQEYFALSKTFDINEPSLRAVQVYLNGEQLTWGKDYEFNDQGFVRVFGKKKSRDTVDIYEYESTVGSYIPPTPTKLGLYPSWEPKLYIDDTTIRPYQDLNTSKSYTIYGQGAKGLPGEDKIGWFYPVYTMRDAAVAEDERLGGAGNALLIKVVGSNTPFFMPEANQHIASQVDTLYDEFNAGNVVIEGHDGSRITAFKDYRDNLLLEYEKRIYNNIKVRYNPQEFDIDDYYDGFHRKSAITREAADKAVISDFLSWSKLINREWTTQIYLNIDNPFTYNFKTTRLSSGEFAPGWWRQMFKYVYDTDRPHTHPWEMLGFKIKPKWWEDNYGAGPYTSNNILMWRDLSEGIIRQPKFAINKKYVRPNLLRNIPVDENGNLKNPSAANLITIPNYNYVNNSFEFGDGGPVESAWRQSSEYPFSIIKGIVISQPSKAFAFIFDKIRQKRNIAGQLVYTPTNNHITLKDIVFPLKVNESSGHGITSGLINYITDYRSILVTEKYNDYKNSLARIKNQLAFKVGGFTDKTKFKLILDARSPLNEGNIFVPDENYSIKLGTSFPIFEHIYSGVIVEKQAEGFYVKGYDLKNPIFRYYKGIERSVDSTVTVGAVSVPYVVWGERKVYGEGAIVAFDDSYWRCKVTHTSLGEFDIDKFAKLPELPTKGGATAKVKKVFENTLSTLPYGSLLASKQDVVDFLLGYGRYLESIGFKFSQYIEDVVEISNWFYAVKQFLFWTTQGWDSGSLIALSPLADRLEYSNPSAAVSNVFDTSVGYSVLRADGTPLKSKYLKLYRDKENNFTIRTSNTKNGIYSVRLPIVLKEHFVLIDNKTVFNDVIYDPPTGYRQERIKVIGYRVDGWNGSLSIPGFVFDEAIVTDWKEWKDYEIGDVVKYKEYYYSANYKVPGSSTFIDSYWGRLASKPESKLYANFDYRADQFRDFYDLDSDNFDAEQQRMAQHLIGYQKRNYLQNIINNEVSQYKFYQGFIQEKGTRNAFTKLFDVLSSTGQESLEFYEEWGIKNSQYGAVNGFDEVEYILDEREFRLVPQPVLLTDKSTGKETDLIYRIPSSKTYLKSQNYNHKPFPTKYVIDTYTKNAGYVNSNDVNFIFGQYTDLFNADIDKFNNNDYIWIGNDYKEWNVYQYELYDNNIISIDKIEGSLEFFIIRLNYIPELAVGDAIGILDIEKVGYEPHEDSALKIEVEKSEVKGFFEIIDITLNEIILKADQVTVSKVSSEEFGDCHGLVSRFKKARVADVDSLVDYAKLGLNKTDKVWIDNSGDNKWCVLERTGSVEEPRIINSSLGYDVGYGTSLAINQSNNMLVVGAPDEDNGNVYVYSRATKGSKWQLVSKFEPDVSLTSLSTVDWTPSETYNVDDVVLYKNNDYKCIIGHTAGAEFEETYFEKTTYHQRFGASVDLSNDGKYLIIGAPSASHVKSKLVGDFDAELLYNQFDIVKYNGIFWEALVNVRRANEEVEFKSFYNFNQSIVDLDLDDDDDPGLNLLLAGNYPLTNLIDVDHFLLRVPTDAYKGITPGDKINLKWNTLTNANQTQINLTPRQPFNGDIPYLTGDYLTNTEHTVHIKVDVVLEIENVLATPPVGSQISTTNAVGRIAYVFNNAGKAVLYINEVVGDFPDRDTIETPDTVIGDFILAAPLSYDRNTIADAYGGYVMILTDALYQTYDNVLEIGRGLLITDIRTDNNPTDVYYYNVLDSQTSVEHGENTVNSLIHALSRKGTRLINAGMYEDDEIILPYYGVRAPKEFSDFIQPGNSISMYFNKLKKTVSILKVRNTRFSFPPEVIAGEILTQANTGAYCTVFTSTVEVAPETTDPTNPVYNIYVQHLSEPAIMFNQLDNLSGSLSGQLYVRPVTEPVVNQLASIEEIGINEYDFIQDDNTISVWNIWDGYIDYEEDYYSYEGLPYVPKSVFVDNGLGDLVDISITPHRVRQVGTSNTADVMYVQRLTNRSVRIYVNNVQGTWSKGSKYGSADEIEMLAYPGQVDQYGRQNIYTIDRPVGTIVRTSLGYPSEGIGKFVVLRNSSNIPIVIDEDTDEQVYELFNTEYWMFLNRDRTGLLTMSNIPSQSSTVWKQVYNVGATAVGVSSPYVYEGLTYIYQKFGSKFVQDKVILSPQRDNSMYFGANVKIRKTGTDFYKGYVLAQAGQENVDNPGKIYFLRQGQEGEEYYNWDYSKDKRFKGTYNDTETYFGGDILYKDTRLLSARTNMLPGPFNSQYWREIDSLVDYVGYVPNDLSYTALVGNDTSSRLDLERLYDFGTVYEVSADGEVIAAYIRYLEEPNNVVIYRNYNGQYIYSQKIVAPSTDSGFGQSISLNDNGSVLVVGAPYNDQKDHDAGKVYVYKLANQQFELDQEILSPANDTLEQFGISVVLSKDHLAISAKNSDIQVPTTIDGGVTTFDNEFTTFAYTDENTGSIYMYEKIGDKYAYGDYISPVAGDLTNSVYEFGKHFIFINSNIYVGLPRYYNVDNTGNVLHYEIKENFYKVLRSPKPTVDVDKIKRVMLYNRKTKKTVTYLDYVDPLQNKFPGLAEENIKYKLYYDPAYYTNGIQGIANIDKTIAWGPKQVGQLWWDITNARYYYPYQDDVTFSTNVWSKTFESNSVDVYEWVESDILPSEWDELADTLEGLAQGISGLSKHGNTAYVSHRAYDEIYKIFVTKYYFWVKGKRILPNIEGRTLHAGDVEDLLQDPAKFGYSYVSLISDDSFAVYNAKQYLEDENIVISFHFYTIEDQRINVHNEYQLMSENLATSVPKLDIERKWVDSLVGYDEFGRNVPDLSLSDKYRYGTLNEPRQSWFVNRVEALKIYVERINYVLKYNLVVDSKNLSRLLERDNYDSDIQNAWDIQITSNAELRNYGTTRIEQAQAVLEIFDGKVATIFVTNPGKGYINPPTFEIPGQGEGARIQFTLNSLGSIASATVVDGGKNYKRSAQIQIRPFTALVTNDETLQGKWAYYVRDTKANSWTLTRVQAYNTRNYWDYADWYADGYDEFIKIQYTIDYGYQLSDIPSKIGDLVKINNVGSGGWLLLVQVDDVPNATDYTINFDTVGRENGTIQFKESLYNAFEGDISFDIENFDTGFYDPLPSREIRFIHQAIKEDIFIEELAVEYNKLFFAMLRYILSEQTYVDWFFKTSFIRAKHNVGELRKDVTFNNDFLPFYEEYIAEVKSFKSKIREYISAYEKTDNTYSRITDFDLSPVYDTEFNRILPFSVKAYSTTLLGTQKVDEYPQKNWFDNCRYEVKAIHIIDHGSGYQSPPKIYLQGGGGYGAEIKTHLGINGSIREIEILNPGRHFISTPSVEINGSLDEGGTPVRVSVELGNTVVRSMTTAMKFDRVASKYEIEELEVVERIISSGAQSIFQTKWPLDVSASKINVAVDGVNVLSSEISWRNILDTSKGYARYTGEITLATAPAKYTEIVISYCKDVDLLHAQDRINLLYDPQIGQYGKDLGQLMDGVDYGGVEVRSFDFGSLIGWDTGDWYNTSYDSYDLSFDDRTMRLPTHLKYYSVLGYKVQINWTAIARSVNAIVQGNSANVNLSFAEMFTFDNAGTQIVDANGTVLFAHPSSILNVAGDNNAVTFASADAFQKYRLGLLEDIVALNNIENEVIPRFNDLTKEELEELIEAGILLEIYFTTDDVIAEGVEYNVYHNGIRIDDVNYGTTDPVINPNAKIKTIVGTGETVSILLRDLGLELETDDTFTLRRPSSDGSFLPSDTDYDTQILGGQLDYGNAKGIESAEIVIDGDNFVTPLTSKGPEEVVPGQIMDTVDIQVYNRPNPGVSTITCRNFTTDGKTKIFPIGTVPLTEYSLLVKIDGKIKKVNTDYKINAHDQTIEFKATPRSKRKLNLTCLDYSGTNVLDVDTISANGIDDAYEINVKWQDDVVGQVSINSYTTQFQLTQNLQTNNTLINLPIIPNKDDIIRYAIFKGDTLPYSTVTVDEFTATGTEENFILSTVPVLQSPEEWHTLVFLNDKLLNPGYTQKFILTDSKEYQLKLWQVPLSSVGVEQLRIFLNGYELQQGPDFTYASLGQTNPLLRASEQNGSTITLNRDVGKPGDELRVYVIGLENETEPGGDYRYGYFDAVAGTFVQTPGVLYIYKDIVAGDNVRVYQFSNHDTQGIDWQSYDVNERTELSQGIIEERAVLIISDTNAVINLQFELEYNQLYSITVNDIRIDDINYGTGIPVTNPFAKTKTYVGDGTSVLRLADIGNFFVENDFLVIEKIGATVTLDEGSADWYEYRQLQNGIVKLHSPAIEDQYVWVAVNGTMLSSSVDYHITNNRRYIRLAKPLFKNDVIQVIHFSERESQQRLGYRIFKDILNRTSYSIVDGSQNVVLEEDLHWYDKYITVKNAELLPDPGQNAKKPAVIFINKERIEYYQVVQNRIQQIRRGTLGTGVPAVHPAGLECYNQSLTQMLPYKDETLVTAFTGDSTTNSFALDFTPNSVNEFEVYVGGIRLRKTELPIFDHSLAQDSPEGDVLMPAEFSIDGNNLILLHTPQDKVLIHVIRRQGKLWTAPGESLAHSDTTIAKMIRSVQVDIPR